MVLDASSVVVVLAKIASMVLTISKTSRSLFESFSSFIIAFFASSVTGFYTAHVVIIHTYVVY